METIFSSASNPLKSAIKIIRVSGESCGELHKIFSFVKTQPRILSLRKIYDHKKKLIDNALVVFFPKPFTVTGEDVFEFHIHGSPLIEKKIYNCLLQIEGFRIAEKGEFTRRAFLNGLVDLTQAEGLNDLINAETERQFQTSIAQYNGSLSDKLNTWRSQIIALLSKLEAIIDFSDEELPHNLQSEFNDKIMELITQKKEALKSSLYAERLKDGFIVTLVGRPNVGKSSLINFLSKKNTSIVTSEAGTTRDIIEVPLDFNGFPVIFNDTAGLRQADSEAEKIGVNKAMNRARVSDIILILSDNGDFSLPKLSSRAKKIYVHTKCDLSSTKKRGVHEVSVTEEIGLTELTTVISDHLEKIVPKESTFLTRQRHIQSVRKSLKSLQNILKIDINTEPELAAEDLRAAAYQIGSITNIIDVEQILDDIFSNFCIGK